jgi:hypothetical protein
MFRGVKTGSPMGLSRVGSVRPTAPDIARPRFKTQITSSSKTRQKPDAPAGSIRSFYAPYPFWFKFHRARWLGGTLRVHGSQCVGIRPISPANSEITPMRGARFARIDEIAESAG